MIVFRYYNTGTKKLLGIETFWYHLSLILKHNNYKVSAACTKKNKKKQTGPDIIKQ